MTMTPTQQLKENAKIQKEIHIEVEKRKSRYIALETAQYLKPSAIVNSLSQQIPSQPKYDVIVEAEKIYKWLIQDLK